MEVYFSNISRFTQRMGNAPKAVEKATKVLLDTATLKVQGKAKELAPVDKSTLRKSILREVKGDTGKVGSNVPYAKYQEFGTGIYGPKGSPITPKNGLFLAWKTKSGTWARARSVKGSPAKHFLQGGVDEMWRDINQILRIAGKALIESI